MCTSVLLGVVGGALVAKLLLRRRFYRGGGCGGFARHGGFGRFRGWHDADVAESGIDLASLAGTLELNARQREDASEVLTKLADAGVRGDKLKAALALAGADTFEPILVEEALGFADLGPRGKEVLDGLEHLHHILTPEQRQKLRRFGPTARA